MHCTQYTSGRWSPMRCCSPERFASSWFFLLNIGVSIKCLELSGVSFATQWNIEPCCIISSAWVCFHACSLEVFIITLPKLCSRPQSADPEFLHTLIQFLGPSLSLISLPLHDLHAQMPSVCSGRQKLKKINSIYLILGSRKERNPGRKSQMLTTWLRKAPQLYRSMSLAGNIWEKKNTETRWKGHWETGKSIRMKDLCSLAGRTCSALDTACYITRPAAKKCPPQSQQGLKVPGRVCVKTCFFGCQRPSRAFYSASEPSTQQEENGNNRSTIWAFLLWKYSNPLLLCDQGLSTHGSKWICAPERLLL